MIRNAFLLFAAGALACFASHAVAQTDASAQTALQRQLSKVEFGVSALGQFNHDVSGTVIQNGAANQGQPLTESPGNTMGALINLRYTRKPYIGAEFNYTYARYTETFNTAPNFIQTGVDEVSFGYLITPPHQIFGMQPYISAGAGSTRFKPTPGGGEGAPSQWRATYYYSLGVQKELGDSHFGVRAGFRQAFFKAPDFLQNYLTILKTTSTIEPNVGFYLRF